MTAVGVGSAVVIGGVTYCFETVRFSVTGKVEQTALFGGGVYRAAAAANGMTVFMRTRLHHSSVGTYLTLMKTLANAKTTVTVEGNAYPNLVLTSGTVASDEGEQYAVCERVLAEVDS